MVSDAVSWLGALFSDVSIRAPHGVGWDIDRAEPPLTLRCHLADGPTAELVLSDGVRSRVAVAEQVQQFIDAYWEVGLPPCPEHDVALRPVRNGGGVDWRCPAGDVGCRVGDYDELLWPPGPETHAGYLLGGRLRRRGVSGLVRYSIADGVVRATVRDGTDEAALRAAAAPYRVELTWTGPIGWRRLDQDGRRELALTNGIRMLARFEGPLHRSPAGGLLVGDNRLELSFPHRIGPPGGPLLLDADGVAFADDGEVVVCGGGFAPSGPVRGAPPPVFVAGRIEVSDGDGRPRRPQPRSPR